MEFEKLLIQIHEILHRSLQRYKEEIIKKSRHGDITVGQLFYLEALYHLESPTLTTLAAHLRISKASASVAVQKLMDRNLVRKVPSSDDQRISYLRLSPEGKKLVEAETRAVAEFMAGMKRALSEEEIASLTAILNKAITPYRE